TGYCLWTAINRSIIFRSPKQHRLRGISMQSTLNPTPSVRFGVFEVDFEAGELRKSGLKVALQEQPFLVLALLLENAGKLVSRDELQQKIWSADTFVEFDRGLNTAINK